MILIAFVCANSSQGQLRKATEMEAQLSYIINKIQFSLADLPVGVDRIALFDIRSEIPSVYMSEDDLRIELMNQLMAAGLRILNIPEFDNHINLKIKSSDSALVIDNRKPITRLKNDNEELSRIAEEYGIEGLFNCNFYYDSIHGPKLSMHIIHPSNKTVLWIKKIDFSRDIIIDQHEFTVGLGIGLQKINTITDSRFGNVITENLLCAPLIINGKYMQYLNHNRSQQLGLGVVLRYVDQTPIKYEDTSLGRLSDVIIPSIGLNYRVSFLPKKSIIPEYWLSFQLGVNYYNYNKSFLGMEQSFMVHLSDKMQWGIKIEQAFAEFDSYANGRYIVNLDNINYATQINITF